MDNGEKGAKSKTEGKVVEVISNDREGKKDGGRGKR
jgi:hypothetical protein